MPLLGRLYRIRTHKGLSLRNLAERSGLELSYLAQLESGEKIPSYQTLETLAEVLDVPLYQLFYVDAAKPPETAWLSPRTSMDELLAFPAKPETGLVRKMKVLRDELSTLLR